MRGEPQEAVPPVLIFTSREAMAFSYGCGVGGVCKPRVEGRKVWCWDDCAAREERVVSDRRTWLQEPCPGCGARPGLRCQTGRYGGKPTRFLHAARGWRQRSCPTCKAQSGQLCRTPAGRRASQPHTARLAPGRRELFAEQGVWEELERWEAATALVRFSGGGGN